MSNRAHVVKAGVWWRVYVNDRMWSSTPTHAEAVDRAHNIASYARRIRIQRDINRVQQALERMEKR